MWQPGAEAPGVELDREGGARIACDMRHKRLPLGRQRALLPIARQRESLLYMLEKHRTIVVVGETGSGKTTQLPQFLHEGGWTEGGRCVACTQPRRLAAVSVAKRVADEVRS